MVSITGLKPFVTEEQIRIVNNLEGVIHQPDLLPSELQKAKRWLKVDLNKEGKWKRPYSHNEAFGWISNTCNCGTPKEFHDWQEPPNQRTLQEVLSQQPEGKAGIFLDGSVHIIDFDRVIDPETRTLIEPTVERAIRYLRTPVYLSSSGTGLHLPLISKNPNLIVPEKNLTFRETKGKSGEWLGANYPSFCAFTGYRLEQFPYRDVAELTDEKWEWLERQLWTHKPTRSISRTVPRTKTAPRRARTARTDVYFGREWKGAKDYLGRLYAWKWGTLKGFNKGNRTDHSLWNQYWLRAYRKYAVNPNVKDMVKFSKEFQRHFDNNAPDWIRLQKSSRHDRGWHLYQCLTAMEDVTSDSDDEDDGDEDIATKYLDHLSKTFVTPVATKMLCQIIAEAKGRKSVRITDEDLAGMIGVSPGWVREMKKEWRKHFCIHIPRSTPQKYIFRPDAPCST